MPLLTRHLDLRIRVRTHGNPATQETLQDIRGALWDANVIVEKVTVVSERVTPVGGASYCQHCEKERTG